MRFDPCCLMSPPPPPLFPPPPQLWKQGSPVGLHKCTNTHTHTPVCINAPHLHTFMPTVICFLTTYSLGFCASVFQGGHKHVRAKCFWRRGTGEAKTCDTWLFIWTPRTYRSPWPRGKPLLHNNSVVNLTLVAALHFSLKCNQK